MLLLKAINRNEGNNTLTKFKSRNQSGNQQTCLLGSNRMVIVCTRNGSNGGASGFTGRKDENGTLTCQLHTVLTCQKAYKRKNGNTIWWHQKKQSLLNKTKDLPYKILPLY